MKVKVHLETSTRRSVGGDGEASGRNAGCKRQHFVTVSEWHSSARNHKHLVKPRPTISGRSVGRIEARIEVAMESNACASQSRIVKELLQEQARAANAELVIQAVPLDAVAGVLTILGRDGAAGRRLTHLKDEKNRVRHAKPAVLSPGVLTPASKVFRG